MRRSTVATFVFLVAAPTVWANPPKPPSSQDFVMAAAQSDHFEVLEAQTVLTQSADPGVRAFAEQMLRDHGRSSQGLARATSDAGLPPPPPGLSDGQQRTLGALQSLRGHEFDRTYAKQQVLAHDEALTVEQTYASQGSSPQLRQAAGSTVPIIQDHLAMAQRLRSSLGGD